MESMLQRALAEALTPAPVEDEVAVRLLDAAHDQFCRLGIRRSTMEDVARRAGVSRITAYRRFATKDVLVEHVVRREFRRYFERFSVEIRQARTAADRVVLGFAASMQAFRDNELIGGLMTAEPDLLVPSMITDGGRTLSTVQRFVAGQLRAEQRSGHISEHVDVDLVAELWVRLSASFLAIPSRVVDLDDPEALRAVARRYLVPMLSVG
ncbi:TetR/AcrR family transcriptional regulator [Actinoplanes utahensis]|uniref:TetR family transcriptional regulator n=1 Tax=Actinoplanes utahensis TaxID=1869 RepID=A0A0A6ULD2_ACTUT|nr:TetR/AcrR family transcriptional regulator [Actinoplanes utahensis]KHD76935.1 TetR family transcriptional regulator [Actinoplanes utahensis]GIF27301.1 TetR family transcriptional regulator [Actinoplanes utahensis]